MKHRRHFLVVEENGTEHRYDRPPDRPYLTVETLSSDGVYVTERTWVKTFSDFRSYPVPKGRGWRQDRKTLTSTSWIRSRKLR